MFEELSFDTATSNDHILSSRARIEIIQVESESLFKELSNDRSHAQILHPRPKLRSFKFGEAATQFATWAREHETEYQMHDSLIAANTWPT